MRRGILVLLALSLHSPLTAGEVLAARELAHPHENEQPFTRSLRGAHIPDGMDEVVIRANDSVHGDGGKTMTVMLRRHQGGSAK